MSAQTLYIKLQSFNVFGGGVQDLSTCTAYTYTPTGVAIDHPVARALLVATSMDFGLVTAAAGTSDDFGTPPSCSSNSTSILAPHEELAT